MSFRRCHSTWKPKNLKQLLLWRNLGNEYQRSLGILHRTPLCGQLSLRDSRRFVQCQLCPDISGTWGSAFEADNSGWQSTGAVYSAKTGSLSMEIPDFSETREFIHRSFRASRYSGYYGASGVSVDAAYSLMIIRT